MFNLDNKKLIDKLLKIDNIDYELQNLLTKTEHNLQEIKVLNDGLNKIVEEKTKGFPWLSDAFAQYYEYLDLKVADFLDNKLRPAASSADRVREIANEKRILNKQLRITRNLIKYYENLFPWLKDFVGEDIDDLIKQVTEKDKEEEANDDPVKFYVTSAEYVKLSPSERNQRALDRYWTKKKSTWELGRDYERYIGYLYEKEGYSVVYKGIEAGLEDLGRDLIAKKDNQLKIIQCKYWAQYKTIHEKHICQLFGTTLKYWVEQRGKIKNKRAEFLISIAKHSDISGVFITSTKLSDTAKEFADELGIEVKENFSFGEYPSIKCNISKKSGEKIYHLPIDQQYDKTIIEEESNECYVNTVAEAEKLGFRRAWKWTGNKE